MKSTEIAFCLTLILLLGCAEVTEEKNISKHIENGQLKVWLKPGAAQNEIVGWNDARGALEVRIKEPAEDNKANKELVNYMSNELNKTVWLKSGYNSRNKTLVVED